MNRMKLFADTLFSMCHRGAQIYKKLGELHDMKGEEFKKKNTVGAFNRKPCQLVTDDTITIAH